MTVELVHDHESDALRGSTAATFARWRGVSEGIVGTALALPGFGVDELSSGECRLFDEGGALADLASGRADVQLLDAGDIAVKTPDAVFALAPRRYPDVLPTLSGFVYDGTSDLPAAGSFTVQAGGGEEIGFFSAVAAPPGEVRLTQIAGLAAAPGIALRRRLDLSIQIEGPDDRELKTGALTYVEVRGGPAEARVTLRCRVAGSTVTLPQAALGELPAGEGVVAAVRAVYTPLRGPAGLKRGELWVEYRDELAVGLR